MTVLVAGATGATGKWLTKHLLDRGHHVRAVVRSPEKLLSLTGNVPNLTLIQASILDLADQEMAEHVRDCDAVASCLGHTLSFKGVYGPPRRLVTEAARRLCQAAMANQPASPVKFVLMNTTGNRNRDLHEPISLAQRAVIALLRLTLPPHVDNEQAAEYLRTHIGQDHRVIEWVVVRPDGLTDADEVSASTTHPSPTRSAIFDAGKVSRINVAHFMADLITDEAIWRKWKGQMPVIYNG